MQRRIDLSGCFNFRDLGGYPAAGGARVRWRQLFRSDGLHHLTQADAEQVVGALGIRRVVDLRSSAELKAEGRGVLESRDEAEFHHLPLFDGGAPASETPPQDLTLADRYFLMAEFAKEPIARVLIALAESGGPAVYHCAAGKDRTGVISAVLLGLLDVPDEIIVADYAASQEQLDSIVERLMSAEGYKTMLTALPADTLHAEPETMIHLLDRVREAYGSMSGYAREIGVGDAHIASLRERLLEPVAG